MDLPCGYCVGCRLERARQWSVRIMHEARFWPRNSFITLTYGDEKLPCGGTLEKRELRLFWKRLRKHHRVRFFACGEYGTLNQRPHYHGIVFNYDFPDRLVCGRSAAGSDLYQSAELAKLWPFGFSTVGDVDHRSASYVARYCVKKLSMPELNGREPEFIAMSRKPGIGEKYYGKFGQEVRDHDSVVIECRPVRPPRYYDQKFESLDPDQWCAARRRRKVQAVKLKADNTVDRRRVKEKIAERNLERLAREL